MSDDAKEWVTVKVEKPVRDDARDDPRTYTEIMAAGIKAEPQREKRQASEASKLILKDLREQLDRIESAAETAEQRTGRIEGTLEDMGGR